MKNLFLIGLVAIISWSCSNNNDDSPEGYPSFYRFLFDFKKVDGTDFGQEEVHYSGKYASFNNDTIFGGNIWSHFQIHEVDETMQIEGQPPVNEYLYFQIIHPGYIYELPDGSEWTMTFSNLFKYEGYEDVDEFMVKWHGRFLPNSRDLDYLEEEFYLNGEPFEPFYTRYFRIEK